MSSHYANRKSSKAPCLMVKALHKILHVYSLTLLRKHTQWHIHTHTHTQLLQTLDRDLISFRGCIDSIESQFDSHENRREIRRMRSELKKKITSAESNLKQQKSKYGRSPVAMVSLSLLISCLNHFLFLSLSFLPFLLPPSLLPTLSSFRPPSLPPTRRSGPEKIQFERLSKQLDSHITTFENLLQKEKKAVQAHPNPPEDSRLGTIRSLKHSRFCRCEMMRFTIIAFYSLGTDILADRNSCRFSPNLPFVTLCTCVAALA